MIRTRTFLAVALAGLMLAAGCSSAQNSGNSSNDSAPIGEKAAGGTGADQAAPPALGSQPQDAQDSAKAPIFDRAIISYTVIAAGLSGDTPYVVLDGRPALPPARTYWIVRNTRDASPDRTTSAAEAEACAGRSRHDTLLTPYAPWQRAILAALGQRQTHYYQMTTCSVQ